MAPAGASTVRVGDVPPLPAAGADHLRTGRAERAGTHSAEGAAHLRMDRAQRAAVHTAAASLAQEARAVARPGRSLPSSASGASAARPGGIAGGVSPAPPHAAHSPALVERRLGVLLRRLRDRRLSIVLGYGRLRDYVVERIGVSCRTAQEWMRVDEALERLPLIARAFETGEIGSAHVRILTRVVEPDTEQVWLDRARRVGVAALARMAAASEAPGDAGAAPVAVGPQGDASPATPLALDEEVELDRLTIPAVAHVSALWRQAVADVRRLTGVTLPPGDCFEMVLAEANGGAPALATDLTLPSAPSPAGDGILPTGEGTGLHACASPYAGNTTGVDPHGDRLHGCAPSPGESKVLTTREGAGLQGCASPAAGQPAPSSREGAHLHGCAPGPMGDSAPAAGGDAPDPDASEREAQAIDAEIQALITFRQRQQEGLAERLRGVALLRSYRDDGFVSLEAWARERLGLSPRQTYYLLALQRTLDRLPRLRGAFCAGEVTLKQALQVGSAANVVTLQAWIGRARGVTLRRLEDEVGFWRHLHEVRPDVWSLLEGYPLPEGLVLEPGLPPRLHSCAPPDAVPIPAAGFLRALHSDEAAVPLPDHPCALRLSVRPGVKEMWHDTLARFRAAADAPLKEWEVLVLVLADFWKTWDNAETRRQRRENPVLDRHGWRCAVPGCRAQGSGRLQEHHVIFRSRGGTDDEWNKVPLCGPHHLQGIHKGRIRCSGRAPDDLVWALGVTEGREPFLVYRGETRIGGAAV